MSGEDRRTGIGSDGWWSPGDPAPQPRARSEQGSKQDTGGGHVVEQDTSPRVAGRLPVWDDEDDGDDEGSEREARMRRGRTGATSGAAGFSPARSAAARPQAGGQTRGRMAPADDSIQGAVADVIRQIDVAAVGRWLRHNARAVALLMVALLAFSLVFAGVQALRGGGVGGGLGQRGAKAPTATPVPTATPTPTPPSQTELDGVITVHNLDDSAPFEGDVQLMSSDGVYKCSNAPQGDSVWHVKLAASGTTTIACVIPIASPSSLAPHTFRKVVTGAGNQGLALVDNPQQFTGAVVLRTPAAGK